MPKQKEFRPKRPKKDRIDAVMLEFFNDANQWEWYGIFFDVTPKEAVKLYYEEMDLNLPGTEDNPEGIVMQGSHAIAEDAQAYYISF